MKNYQIFKLLSLLLIISFCTFLGCKKEIAEQGPKGDPGLAGPAGSTVLSGTGSPATTIGLMGDFYLDIASSNFYGPKKADGWGTPFSMKGAVGQTGATGATGATGTNGANGSNGAAGSKILSGTITPTADLGVIGDYYLDKTTYNFYGPKTDTGWGVALSLKGTANVMYSGWNYAKSFRDTLIDNTSLKVASLTAPALTTAILNSGTIQVYFNFGGGIFPLPYSSYAGGKLNTISYIPTVGRFNFTRFTADNTNSVALSTLLQYRYVIIPGGTAVSVAGANKPNLKDYQAVQKFYGIGN
ncbi:hypothetical protein EZ449_19205 [Pedobacter frigidisoli]|uniref:Collagen triple helix repeat-containing protein n=1 Tax=Pedobacter frigidisoli TaxID=2530455 RepID=A0A4V2MLI4_9SPHI|nr:hypothetical protein [Pedobacter frigidisoli]TCD02187.1 hypothetical protein EZ449_19205 [Pedobacter frigidisoli]